MSTQSKLASHTLAQANPTFSAALEPIGRIAARVVAWVRGWPAADAARQQLEMMSDRELLDIGMTRVDVRRTAWGESPRDERHPADWF